MSFRRAPLCAALLAAGLMTGNSALAQESAVPAAGQGTEQTAPAEPVFTAQELEKLLAPVALYPDSLLAQILPASAYPLDIVQAQRWIDRNKTAVSKGDYTAADALAWDPSVKALVRFPDLIKKLNADLDWTSDLGDAFVTQPQDVADTIQALRRMADQTGALKTTKQQKVVREKQGSSEVIVIQEAEPGVIYVPTYDPVAVYQPNTGAAIAAGLLTFGTAVAIGSVISNNSWNWGSGYVYPPRWPGYPPVGYYPGRPGGGNINNGNINIGNDINIGNNNLRPWRPDNDRYRPGQGTKPGLANPGNRPGRPGGGNTVNIGGGNTTIGSGNTNIGGSNANIGNSLRPGGGNTNIGNNLRPGGDNTNIGNNLRPGGGDRPDINGVNRPGGGDRPALGGGDRPNINGGGRPGGGDRPSIADRPGNAGAGTLQRPTTKPAQVQRPQTRPAPSPQRPTALNGIDFGGGASSLGNRGASSRIQARPGGGGGYGGGGPAMRPGGGGGGPAMRGGGGGGPRMGGGGGGMPRHGGGGGGRGGGRGR